MNVSTPVISVIMPVYNTGKYVGRALDSLLSQTITEKYEIICVYGNSSDNSLDILLKYQNAYPDIISVKIIDKEFSPLPEKRNYGMQFAKGEYIYHCDSDDIVHTQALEKMYNAAINNKADVVFADYYFVKTVGDEIIKPKIMKSYNGVSGPVSVEDAVMCASSFWISLVKKELFDKMGPIPTDVFMDDVSYMPALKTYANKIYYLNEPIYYWFRRSTSITGSLSPQECIGTVKAEKHIIQKCNPKYRYAVQKYVCNRIVGNMSGRWICSDMYIEWAKELWPEIKDNRFIKEDKRLYDQIEHLTTLSLFDTNVYINGFSEKPSEERITELTEKAFYESANVVVLSLENCDINKNEYIRQAYNDGDYELVGSYFALKSIYENGGIFIHEKIKVLNFFNDCRHLNSFFTFIDNTTYSDRVFGGKKGNEAIESLLKTFSFGWDKESEYMPLAERIKIILTAKYDVPLNGFEYKRVNYYTRVFSPDNMVVDPCVKELSVALPTHKLFCEHDCSDMARDENYVTIKRSTLEQIINQHAAAARHSVRTKPIASNKENALRKELNDIKNSDTYKAAMRIKKFANTKLGKPFKKIFKWFLKKYRKHKYGIG